MFAFAGLFLQIISQQLITISRLGVRQHQRADDDFFSRRKHLCCFFDVVYIFIFFNIYFFYS